MRSITNARIGAVFPSAGRQRIALGGAVIAALAGYLLYPSEDEAAPAVELAATVPPPVPTAPAPAVPAPAAPLPDLKLIGIGGGGPSGRAAIIGFPNGGQRVVRAGRTVANGVTLKEVGVGHVILQTASGEARLDFRQASSVLSPAPVSSSLGRAGALPAAKQVEAEKMELFLGMAKPGGAKSSKGYVVKGSAPSALAAAGLRRGDILLSVNGQEINDEERLLELPYEINSASATVVTYQRNGVKKSVQIK